MQRKRFTRRNRGFRRKRGSGGVWLPTLGTNWITGEENYVESGFSFRTDDVSNVRSDGPTVKYFPVTKDFTVEPETFFGLQTQTLRDEVQGNAWLLKRIVGRLNLECEQSDTSLTDDWPFLQVAAGFFVSRAADVDQSFPDLGDEEIDVMGVNNIADPWIWRRTWLLANPASLGALNDATPTSNSRYNGDLGGPVIDSKVARRIEREHRLWFAISTMGWNGSDIQVPDSGAQPRVKGWLDIRLFGRMTSGRRTGSF